MTPAKIGHEYLVLNLTYEKRVTDEAVDMISVAIIQDARMNVVNHFLEFEYDYDEEI